MSGKPNPDGVKDLIACGADLKNMRKRACELRHEIENQQRESAELASTIAITERQFREALDAMDVRSPGNAGYEGRMEAMLLMLCEEANHGKK